MSVVLNVSMFRFGIQNTDIYMHYDIEACCLRQCRRLIKHKVRFQVMQVVLLAKVKTDE